MSQNIQEFNKYRSQLKRDRTIKECFYHKKEECRGGIKQAHSIQRNKRLNIIEENINGNNQLYTFTEFEVGENHFIKELKPIGKKKASTFFGFCDFHDNKLFSEIENKGFDESDLHCFLHSYRSFAHSYHRKNEELKGNIGNNRIKDENPDFFNQEIIKGNKLAINDLETHKKSFDYWIENGIYDELDYYSVIFPELYPIACSSLVSPFYTLKNRKFNYHSDPTIPYSPLILTVLPDFNQTIVIIACFKNDKEGVKYLDDIEELNDYKLKIFLSTLLIYFAENTFFSPQIWKKLRPKGQRLFCDELERGITLGMFERTTQFEYSKINLFDIKFRYQQN